MKGIPRALGEKLAAAARAFPAVVLTGPRRAGKTWLLRHAFPQASYFLLEDPEVVSRLRADPQGFLDDVRLPVILDEIQNVPEVFAHVRARIDRAPSRKGQWFLTGSQEAPLMSGVSESMAGRAAILQLLPLSTRESPRVSMLRGGYPEVVARPAASGLWFSSYLQSYLERDVRSVLNVRDLATFRRFLSLLASRHGQLVNRADLAAPLGVSVPTVNQWLGVLETTAQILVIPPLFENFGKRLLKSPRIYIADPGLACHLLGIDSSAELARSPFAGAIFEGFIASEIVKSQASRGVRRELYHFRDAQGLEVDFVLPRPGGKRWLVECKFGRTATPSMTRPMQQLARAMPEGARAGLQSWLVHQAPRTPLDSHAIAPGVKACSWQTFVEGL